jgi:hypothetical protein
MKNILRALTLAIALGLLISSGQAIDFQLKEYRFKDLDGVGIDLYFTHEANRIFYRPPPGWRREESKATFIARPPAGVSGVMSLETSQPISDTPVPGTNTPEALAAYEKIALRVFDARLQEPKVVESAAEKLGGRALSSTRVVIEYRDQVLVRRYTICFVQFRPDILLLVKIDSLKQDAAIHEEALHSLEGFTEMPPQS